VKTRQILIFLIILFIAASCVRIVYFPDRPLIVEKTIILAHKGGGTFDEGNTLEACKYGLALADGIECDLQRSWDNVLFLSHSCYTSVCGDFPEDLFAVQTASRITRIDSCLGREINYARLESLFQYMSSNYPDKLISLDVKSWPSGPAIFKQMNDMAQEIIDLTEKYHLEDRVKVESETGDFLYYVKTHSNGIETYLSTFGDFERGVSRALNAGFSGISFRCDTISAVDGKMIDLIHRKGLKIQLWTLDEPSDIKEAMKMKPDFIQTDNLEYFINN
jgi:glycerophosphoryl diester phosphodiesterase